MIYWICRRITVNIKREGAQSPLFSGLIYDLVGLLNLSNFTCIQNKGTFHFILKTKYAEFNLRKFEHSQNCMTADLNKKLSPTWSWWICTNLILKLHWEQHIATSQSYFSSLQQTFKDAFNRMSNKCVKIYFFWHNLKVIDIQCHEIIFIHLYYNLFNTFSEWRPCCML